MTDSIADTPQPQTVRLRGILLGERINTTKLEHGEVLSTAPLAYRVGDGFAVIFRYGVVVFAGLTRDEEASALALLRPHVTGAVSTPEDETVNVVCGPAGREDEVPPGGPIAVKDLTTPRLLVVADALAKSVALARYERLMSSVFDELDPLAQTLARHGQVKATRKRLLQLIGQALLVEQRVSGRIAADDKPDVLWDRPEFERLYARLDDEYELAERAESLTRKLSVLQETARILTELLDVQRSARLEVTIILLIMIEIVLTLVTLLPLMHR